MRKICLVFLCLFTAVLSVSAGKFDAGDCSGILSGDGYIHPNEVPDPCGGCPDVGFEDTQVDIPDFWGNCAWWYKKGPDDEAWGSACHANMGFEDVQGVDNAIRVEWSNFNQSAGKDVIGQSDLADYFWNFQVRIPANPPDELKLIMDLETNGVVNAWFEQLLWHWFEENSGETLYAPFYRFFTVNKISGEIISIDSEWIRTVSVAVSGIPGNNEDTERMFKIQGISAYPSIPGSRFESRIQVASGLNYTLKQRDDFIDGIRNSYSDCCRVFEFEKANGLSFTRDGHEQERTLRGLVIHDPLSNPSKKETIYISGGVHIEPTGPYVLEGMVNYILENHVYENYNFVVLPIANLDAYAWATPHYIPFRTFGALLGWHPDKTRPLPNGMDLHKNLDSTEMFVEAYKLLQFLDEAKTILNTNIDLFINLHGDDVLRPEAWSMGDIRNGPTTYYRIQEVDSQPEKFASNLEKYLNVPDNNYPNMEQFIRDSVIVLDSMPSTPPNPEDQYSYEGFNWNGEKLKYTLVFELGPNLLYADETFKASSIFQPTFVPVIDPTNLEDYFATKNYFYKGHNVDAVMNPVFHRDMGAFIISNIIEAYSDVFLN